MRLKIVTVFAGGLLGLAGLLGLIVGCSNEVGPKKYDVSGTVKVDGTEVAEGEIVFQSDNQSIGAEGGMIKDGKYALKAREGKNKVQIRATRIVPGKKGPMGEDWVEQFVPDQYNEKSTLSAEVSSGKTKHNFELKY